MQDEHHDDAASAAQKPAAPCPELLEAAQPKPLALLDLPDELLRFIIDQGRAACKHQGAPSWGYRSPYFGAGRTCRRMFSIYLSTVRSETLLAPPSASLQEAPICSNATSACCPRYRPSLHCNSISTLLLETFLETLIIVIEGVTPRVVTTTAQTATIPLKTRQRRFRARQRMRKSERLRTTSRHAC
jgi:hypothetical protein